MKLSAQNISRRSYAHFHLDTDSRSKYKSDLTFKDKEKTGSLKMKLLASAFAQFAKMLDMLLIFSFFLT